MKLKNILTIFALGSAMVSMNSCVDLETAPKNKFTDNNYWTSQSKAEAVLNTAYGQMFGSGYYFNNEILSDNAYNGRAGEQEFKIVMGSADATNGRFTNEWGDCYKGIKTCNLFLENVDKVVEMDAATISRLKAEARFIRAFLYFRLTNWYGAVPLFDKSITVDESQTIMQTPEADVKKWIHDELTEIVADLPTNKTQKAVDKGRITKGAAIALNARVYLYDNDWANCQLECEKLIGTTVNGTYAKEEKYADIFLPTKEYGSEVILDMGYVNTYRTWDNMRDLAPLTAGARLSNIAPTQELVSSYRMLDGSAWEDGDGYEGRDLRMDATIVRDGSTWKAQDGSSIIISTSNKSTTIDGWKGTDGKNESVTGYYYRKNYDATSTAGAFQAGLNLILIRYADVLLMYAESMNEQGKMNANIWNSTIKPIRERAGFNASFCAFPTASKESLRADIRQERRCELALEGLRVFDLRRWMKLDNISNNIVVGVLHGDKFADNGTKLISLNPVDFTKYYFAIPQGELDINKNLVQNEEYK